MSLRWKLAILAAALLVISSFGFRLSSGPDSSATHVTGLDQPVIPVAVSFVSPTAGWELGRSHCLGCAALRVTNDGGQSWTSLPAPPTSLSFNSASPSAVSDVVFADDTNGWLFGPGLYATHDGGSTWVQQTVSGVVSVQAGGDAVYAQTKRQLWQSTIAGDTWQRLRVPSFGPNGAKLAVAGAAVMLLREGFQGPGSGTPGSLWLSADGGRKWSARAVPCQSKEGGAAAIAAVTGEPGAWLLDCFSNEQSQQEQQTSHVIYLTKDGARTWRSLGRPTRQGQPSALAAAGDNYFLATESGGADQLVGSVDGGKRWRVGLDLGGLGFTGWADLRFVDASTGFFVAPTHFIGAAGRDHIYRTDDAGRHWRTIG